MIAIAKQQIRRRTMTILAIPPVFSKSVKEYFEKNGVVKIPRPQECMKPNCRSKTPLWSNGSYLRQVIYFGFLFLYLFIAFVAGDAAKQCLAHTHG
jgi:hypothetical protein